MDAFNVTVGVFSIASTIVAFISFFQAKRAKTKSDEVEKQLITIQKNTQNISIHGGSIKAGGDIKAGKGIHVSGVEI